MVRPRVLHLVSPSAGRTRSSRVRALVAELDGTVGIHRLTSRGWGVARRTRPDLVVAHGHRALVGVLATAQRPAPVVHHRLGDDPSVGRVAARLAARRVALAVGDGDGEFTVTTWRQVVEALLGPTDRRPPWEPGSLEDVVVPQCRAERRSPDVMMVAGPGHQDGPLLLRGIALAAFDAFDGQRSLEQVVVLLVHSLQVEADVAAEVVWDVARRGCRAGVLGPA